MKKPNSVLSFRFGKAPIPSKIEPSCLKTPDIPRPMKEEDSCLGSRVVAYGIGVCARDGLEIEEGNVSSKREGVPFGE